MTDAGERLLAALAGVPRAVRDAEVLHLPANTPPWTATGITLAKGCSFTLFAEGRVVDIEHHARLLPGTR